MNVPARGGHIQEGSPFQVTAIDLTSLAALLLSLALRLALGLFLSLSLRFALGFFLSFLFSNHIVPLDYPITSAKLVLA